MLCCVVLCCVGVQEEGEQPSVDSEQDLVVLLAQCERKLHKLQGALQGRNLADVLKDMKDEEVRS